jgi:DNA-directed RNA polymerase alpha subunit
MLFSILKKKTLQISQISPQEIFFCPILMKSSRYSNNNYFENKSIKNKYCISASLRQNMEESKTVSLKKKKKELYQITCKQSLILNNRNFYSSFYLGPFVSGQSLTVANALRRTLLSELYGVAILAVEIEGVNHEYSNIQGVKETVLDIVLNLKEIVLKPNARLQNLSTLVSDIGVIDHLAFLQVTGPGIIRARDIKLPPYLLLVDPDQYIATLADDGSLTMKLYISFGQNFKSSSQLLKNKLLEFEQNSQELTKTTLTTKSLKSKTLESNASFDMKDQQKKFSDTFENDIFDIHQNEKYSDRFTNESDKKDKIKTKSLENSDKNQLTALQKETISTKQTKIPFILYLDPVFMPVTRVNYIIEENPLDFSSQIIFLEIWTNGSIHPRKALQEAFKKLVNVFFCFWEYQNNIFLTNIKKKEKNLEKRVHTFFD